MWALGALQARLGMAGLLLLPLRPLPLLMHTLLLEGVWGVAGVGVPSANRFLGRLGLSRFLWVWGLSGPISLLGLSLVRGEVGPLLTPHHFTRRGRALFGCPCP